MTHAYKTRSFFRLFYASLQPSPLHAVPLSDTPIPQESFWIPVGRHETLFAIRQIRKISHDINIFHCVTTTVLLHYCILVSHDLLGKFEIGDSRTMNISRSH